MRHSSRPDTRFRTGQLWLPALLAGVLLLSLWVGIRPAQALPEYAARTGEACATCHVNPGGGGPRTMRGLLWAARGRPDKVPVLRNMLIAPGVAAGNDLFEIACAGCHGLKGEGLFAMALTGTGVGKNSISSYVRYGIISIGMPSFDGQFTDAQFEALVTYVAGLASGEIPPPPDSYPLAEPQFRCQPGQSAPAVGCESRPAARRGGN